METSQEAVCREIFEVLLAQLIFLALWSLIAQSGPVFVQRVFFGLDFRDFYRASLDWLHGSNPYLRGRLYTPPPSLLVGLFLAWVPFGIAAVAFFTLNLTVIVWSVRACGRKLELSAQCIKYLTAITLLFYPVYVLIERGNLEGLILGCLCWAFCTQNKYIRGFLIALAAGLKVYPLLLIAPAIRRRQWTMAVVSLLAFAVLLLLFYRQLAPFVHAVIGRGELYQRFGNISPAAIFVSIAGKRIGKLLFLLYWAGTLALMLYQLKSSSASDLILPFLPWMVAFPMQVYPYGGVLLLPVLAWKVREMKHRAVGMWDKIFIWGFLLVGVQATALTVYFQAGMPALLNGATADGTAPRHPIFSWMNSLGMCLILGSLSLSRLIGTRASRDNSKQQVESQRQPA